MKNLILLLITAVFISGNLLAGGVKVGDKAPKFSLENVDGTIVSLDDYAGEKGVIVIFTCNHCPYSIAYEDRIIALHKEYALKGYPVVAINPNDPEVQPGDSFEEMKKRAAEKEFPFPYLFDDGQKVFPKYGATRTPHVFLLQNTGKKFEVAYIGAIDDNYQDADAVEENYLADAIGALLDGNKPDPDFTKAIGCTVKVKK
jgi:peroxiredoxin